MSIPIDAREIFPVRNVSVGGPAIVAKLRSIDGVDADEMFVGLQTVEWDGVVYDITGDLLILRLSDASKSHT